MIQKIIKLNQKYGRYPIDSLERLKSIEMAISHYGKSPREMIELHDRFSEGQEISLEEKALLTLDLESLKQRELEDLKEMERENSVFHTFANDIMYEINDKYNKLITFLSGGLHGYFAIPTFIRKWDNSERDFDFDDEPFGMGGVYLNLLAYPASYISLFTNDS